MSNAHCGAIAGMSCFPSEPILVTSSPDNTIKQVSSFFLSNCNVYLDQNSGIIKDILDSNKSGTQCFRWYFCCMLLMGFKAI